MEKKRHKSGRNYAACAYDFATIHSAVTCPRSATELCYAGILKRRTPSIYVIERRSGNLGVKFGWLYL